MADNDTDRMQKLEDVMAELHAMRIEAPVKSMVVIQSADQDSPGSKPIPSSKPSRPWPAFIVVGGFMLLLIGLWFARSHSKSAAPVAATISRPMRFKLAAEQARHGDVDAACREAETLCDADCTPSELISAAVTFTIASQRSTADRVLAEHRAARAVLFLRRAMVQGMPGMDEVWSHSELKPLHQRKDFRALTAEWLRH